VTDAPAGRRSAEKSTAASGLTAVPAVTAATVSTSSTKVWTSLLMLFLKTS